jgi:uncharacterized damage-inducible protein DinB
MYGAEVTWLARWQGTPAGTPSDIGDTNDIARLRDKWRALWDRQSAWAASISDDDARRAIGVTFRDGRTFEQQLGATMRHCLNHATYHRGQVTNYLRMLGAKPVGTDLVLYYMDHPPA